MQIVFTTGLETVRSRPKLSEDALPHLAAKCCRQFRVKQELREPLVPAGSSFHDLVENHFEPPSDNVSRLIATVPTKQTNRIFDKLREQCVGRDIFHDRHFTTLRVTPLH